MEKNSFLWIIASAWLLTAGNCYSQNHRFMVFFQEKNSSYNIEDPQEFLSQRAIDRRTRQGIEITMEDLPVSQEYISSLEALGVQVFYTTKWMNGALIQTDSTTLTAIGALSFVSTVELVAPGPLMAAPETFQKYPNGIQHGRIQSTELQNHLLGIDLMQQEGFTGEGMLIGVFDGGFLGVDEIPSFGRLFQNDQVISTFDFVGNNVDPYRYDDHGTKVLSVIGAYDPGIFTGGAYDADFILFVTEDVSGEYRVEEYNWLFAAEMADSIGVDIISTSLGYHVFDDPDMNYSTDDMDGMTAAVSKAAKIAASKGILLTVSAGNEGNSSWMTITAPADVADILTVGAISEDSVKASFSSVGPTADGRIKPDVVALGVSTAVINRHGNMVFNNGTSFSAPQIAALSAGVWQANPDFNYLQVIQAIRESGHQSQSADLQTGFGIPNYYETKKLVLATDEPGDQWFLKLYPNPVTNSLFILTELPLSTVTLFIHNIEGKKYFESKLENIPAFTEFSMELPLLSAGIYLVTALTEESAGTYRLIKE